MLKKIRNRSLTKNECELIEFAKRLRNNTFGNIHVNRTSMLSSKKNSRKSSINVLTEIPKNTEKGRRQSFLSSKDYSGEEDEILHIKRRRKISYDTFPLTDEKKKIHFFPLYKENQYPMFNHECFIPVIELETDNDVLSDKELINISQEGIYNNIEEVFKLMSSDNNYLINNLSRKIRLER